MSPHSPLYTRTLPHNTNLFIIEHVCHNGRGLDGPGDTAPGSGCSRLFIHYLCQDQLGRVVLFCSLPVRGRKPGLCRCENWALPQNHSLAVWFLFGFYCLFFETGSNYNSPGWPGLLWSTSCARPVSCLFAGIKGVNHHAQPVFAFV